MKNARSPEADRPPQTGKFAKPAFKNARTSGGVARPALKNVRPSEADRPPQSGKFARPAFKNARTSGGVARPVLKNARTPDAGRPPQTGGIAEPVFKDAATTPKPLRGRGFRSGPPPADAIRPQRQPKAVVTGEGKRPLKTLERVLSKAGICSRTEARSHIGAGRVTVNGHVIRTPDFWVDLSRDKVALEGEPVRLKDRDDLYIALNKPKGYISTYKDPEGRPTVYELVRDLGEWVVPVGRLDQDTTGLLLMTNDTQFADRMTNPDHKIPKTYLVKASTLLTEEQLDALRKGVDLNDGPTRPAKVEWLRDSGKYTHFELTITEGRNRQVRRMVEAVGSKVLKLVRVKIGQLQLEGIEIGKWKRLSDQEIKQLRG